jgi:cobalt-zinc-cadmium efflux system outer membrane protein
MADQNNQRFAWSTTFRFASYSLILAVLAWLTGCAHYQPRPLSAEKAAVVFDQRSLNSEDLKAFVEKNRTVVSTNTQGWNFEDLCLAAFYYQPDLAVARATWGVARAGEETAGQHPNPVLSVNPGYNATTAMASPWLMVSSLDVPVETAGKRKHRRAEAARLSESARLNLIAIAWQTRSRLRTSLIDFIAVAKRKQLLQAQLELQQQMVRRLDQQKAVGAIATFETVPSRVAEAKAQIDLADAQRLTIEARARLAESIGVPLRAVENLKLAAEVFVSPNLNDLTSSHARTAALTSRADILAGLADYAAAEAALQLEIAKQYPDVHFQPGYEFDQGDSKWSLGVSVELPVLNRNQGPIAQAKARRSETAAKFNALQAKVTAEVDRSVESVRANQMYISSISELAAAEANRRTNVEAQLKAGAADEVELLTAQLEMSTTELARFDGQIKLQQAIGALEDAIQLPIVSIPAIFQADKSNAP